MPGLQGEIAMYRLVYAAIAVGTLLSAEARAGTVPDPKEWAQQFAAIAAHADKDALFAALRPVTDPRITSETIKTALDAWDRTNEGRTARSSSIIREIPLGDVIYRFDLAVHYGDFRYRFYSVDMVRGDDGWEVIYLNLSTDLNVILNTPWPYK
jgi:hypothetical protein